MQGKKLTAPMVNDTLEVDGVTRRYVRCRHRQALYIPDINLVNWFRGKRAVKYKYGSFGRNNDDKRNIFKRCFMNAISIGNRS